MGPYPDAASCRTLLTGLGGTAELAAHVEAVAHVAVAVARAVASRDVPVDVDLVRAGALLHDVGRARTHGLDHAHVGADMLRRQGWPEPLCLVVERHTGGGIDPDEAHALGLPVRDYTPRTLEERIVCQADNLVDGTRRQKVQEELAHLRERGLDRVAAKIERGHRSLSELAGRDLDEVA